MNVTIKSHRPQVEKKIVNKLYSNMDKVGLIVERQAKINTMHPKPSGKEHPERTDTGRLASSITHWTYLDRDMIGVSIGTNVKYGKYLELGTVNHSPYPWLFPAVERNRDRIADILQGKITIEQIS